MEAGFFIKEKYWNQIRGTRAIITSVRNKWRGVLFMAGILPS
jgi:hypothetical protein